MKRWIVIVSIAGITVLLLVSIGYFVIGKFTLIASNNNADWGNFGSYFGGIAGPILTFISTILIVITITQQQFEINESKKDAIKLDMLRYLDKLDNDISQLLSRPILLSDGVRYAEFGDMVYGIQNPAYYARDSYVAALEKLARLTAHYSESIALYRENVNAYFVFRAHRDKAKELIEFLEKNIALLSTSTQIALSFSRTHIEGDPSN